MKAWHLYLCESLAPLFMAPLNESLAPLTFNSHKDESQAQLHSQSGLVEVEQGRGESARN
jgi:hypothetical protein